MLDIQKNYDNMRQGGRSMIHQTEIHDSQICPLQTFQKLTGPQIEGLRKKLARQEKKEEEEEERLLLCKNCKNKITSLNNSIEVRGQYKHTFSNPHGFIFEIVCFSLADGCVNQGMLTMEFTWFKGFGWRFALCSNCRIHLGWLYQSGRKKSFYGLISDSLITGT